MRGRILAFDSRAGEGQISGDDGQRYRFAAHEWRPRGAPARGEPVDFEADGHEARAVYTLGRNFGVTHKNRIAAALLAIFLGALGLHKFYLDRNAEGLVMLLVSVAGVAVAGIPSGLMAALGFVEGVIYLLRSDESFDRLYVEGRRAWL